MLKLVASGRSITVLDHGVSNETYNIDASIGRSNLEVMQAMEPLLKSIAIALRIKYVPSRRFDVKVNILDCGKLRQRGWRPATDFEDGLERRLAWLIQ